MNCEYGTCDAQAEYEAEYWQSEVFDGIAPENDRKIIMRVCRDCAENGCPPTVRLTRID